jgi:hypothetical protein
MGKMSSLNLRDSGYIFIGLLGCVWGGPNYAYIAYENTLTPSENTEEGSPLVNMSTDWENISNGDTFTDEV